MQIRTRHLEGHPGGNWPYRIINHTSENNSDHTVNIDRAPFSDYSWILSSSTEERNKYIFHDVLHHKFGSSIGGYQPDWLYGNIPMYTTFWENELDVIQHILPTMLIIPHAIALFPELRSPPPFNSILHRAGYAALTGSKWIGPKLTLSSGFSLINFLLEYRETMRLATSWVSKRALLDRWHALLGRNQSLPERLRAVANERLAHVYGTRPFIRDAYTLFKILQSWKSRADKFLAGAGKIKISHKTVPLFSTYISPSTIRSFPVFEAQDSSLSFSWITNVDIHATLAYKYSVPAMKGLIGRLAQLSSSLGVGLDAGIVWDAIPLSFTVDWFINVSEWLHSNVSQDVYEAEVVLLDYCHSGKVTMARNLQWSRYVNGGLSEMTLYQDSWTQYRRKRDLIPRLTKQDLELASDPWKVTNIINAGALGVQRSTKRRVLKRKNSR